MLGKLMKYEIRSCGRIFFPFYIIVLVFSILGGLFINFDNGVHDFSFVYLMGMLAAFALFVAAIVLTIVLIVQRFNKSLLGDEGYLMFTLPVGEKALVLSKFLTALLFIILTAIVSIVSISLVGAILSYKINDIFDMGYMFNLIGQIASGNIGNIAFHLFSSIVDYSVFILTIYLVSAICHLNIFSKHKVLSALGSFIVLSVIQSGIEGAIALLVTDDKALAMSENISGFDVNGFFNAAFSVGTYDFVIFAANVIIAVALFFATTILLNKKLNLE